jgi:hypothetical protein
VSRKSVANVTVFLYILSAILFFVLPHHEYVPKLLYISLTSGLSIWFFSRRRIKQTIIFLCATLFIILTLPNSLPYRETELVIMFVILLSMSVTQVVIRRRHKPAE